MSQRIGGAIWWVDEWKTQINGEFIIDQIIKII